MSRYTIKDDANCLNTTNSCITHVSNNCSVADDRSQLLSWLSPLDPGLRHWDIQERRVEDVGEWLIQTKEFKKWCGLSGEFDADKMLFCFAMEIWGWVRHSSGRHDCSLSRQRVQIMLTDCGHSSLVVDRLCDQTTGQSTAVTCFYFDFARRAKGAVRG